MKLLMVFIFSLRNESFEQLPYKKNRYLHYGGTVSYPELMG